jgi:hypothetical protein
MILTKITYSQKRKRVARRMIRQINWKLCKLYCHGFHFEQREQKLIYSRAWYEAQLIYKHNIFTGYWRPATCNLQLV